MLILHFAAVVFCAAPAGQGGHDLHHDLIGAAGSLDTIVRLWDVPTGYMIHLIVATDL
jgi:hypothetical protein